MTQIRELKINKNNNGDQIQHFKYLKKLFKNSQKLISHGVWLRFFLSHSSFEKFKQLTIFFNYGILIPYGISTP